MIRNPYRKLSKWERFLQRFYYVLRFQLTAVGTWAAILFVLALEVYWLRLEGLLP